MPGHINTYNLLFELSAHWLLSRVSGHQKPCEPGMIGITSDKTCLDKCRSEQLVLLPSSYGQPCLNFSDSIKFNLDKPLKVCTSPVLFLSQLPKGNEPLLDAFMTRQPLMAKGDAWDIERANFSTTASTSSDLFDICKWTWNMVICYLAKSFVIKTFKGNVHYI